MSVERTAYEAYLRERREQILARVAEACQRAGRDASDIELIAVSKTVGPDEVMDAVRAGWTCFGENRPQELARKLEALSDEPEFAGARMDMIGNLQKNKINQVLRCLAAREHPGIIHSVSSLHLAQAIDARVEAQGLCAPSCLLEVNVVAEQSKSGFSPDELRASIEDICALAHIRIAGLMGMAPAHDADGARRAFSGLRELRDELAERTGEPLATLSCGMSDDFELAIEEGSTLLRLGRCVFDQTYGLQ